MTSHAHHHADIRQRHTILTDLRTLRHRLGINQQDIGDDLHLTRGAISAFETRGRDPHLWTLHRYARALDHRTHLELHLPATTLPPPAGGNATDQADLAALRAQLVAGRKALKLTQLAVGERMGVDASVVRAAEGCTRGECRLGTYQRHARALGGRLTCRLLPAPPVDPVKLDLVHDGKERFGTLTRDEQVALFRRYGRSDIPNQLMTRWGVSGARFRQLAEAA